MENEKVERYYCNKEHINGTSMYHYNDEVIYQKHLTSDCIIEVKEEEDKSWI